LLPHPSFNFALPDTIQLPSSLDKASVDAFVKSLAQPLLQGSAERLQGLDPREADPEYTPPNPQRVLTENAGTTFDTSASACVDVFFKIVQDTPDDTVEELLSEAWQENPGDALKLIAQLRDIRHGKSERERTYAALHWLKQRHPLTLVHNLKQLVGVGYWKDLLQLVARAAMGEEEWERREQQREAWEERKKGDSKGERRKEERRKYWRNRKAAREAFAEEVGVDDSEEGKAKLKAARIKAHEGRNQAMAASAQADRRELRVARVQKVRQLLESDPLYRLLHCTVAVLFAQQLQKDVEDTKAGKRFGSLAAKWAPTPHLSHDKDSCIASTIAQLLFPHQSHRRPDMSYEDYVEVARRKYQKEVLTPLRAAAGLPEVLMSARRWSAIDYEHVASVSMKNNSQHFLQHDGPRFEQYLADVADGKAKIAAGALKPHQMVKTAMAAAGASWSEAEAPTKVALATAEMQWKAYVAKLQKSGNLASAIAVCDVSGSMRGQPMEVAIALSMLVSELAAEPYRGLLITFSEKPELHQIKGSSLAERVRDIKDMEWGMSTNLQAVFDRVLEVAVGARVPPEAMVKTLFIFSDMEFDEAVGAFADASSDSDNPSGSDSEMELDGASNRQSTTLTDFEAAKEKFRRAGYELPNIVFWNLRGSERLNRGGSTPVTMHQTGAALMSGFSGHLLKLFMDGKFFEAEAAGQKQQITPYQIMRSALERYDKWRVVD